jgi:hypothetical protein
MSNWLYLLIIVIVVCLFINNKRNNEEANREHFLAWIREAIKTNQDFNDMIFRNVSNYNGIAKDWVPNISWIYNIKDKNIERARADRGLPPIVASPAAVKVDLNSNNNRYSVGFKP